MRITWAGVPKDSRGAIRRALRGFDGSEFLVCSDRSANRRARDYIRDSLWAFNANFIAGHARGNLDPRAIKSLEKTQHELCEDANELVFSMLKSFPKFWRGAIRADGRGHFLSSNDGEEQEIRLDGKSGQVTFFIYRIN